jgi:hypothetical protein
MPTGKNDDCSRGPIVQVTDQTGLALAEGIRRRNNKLPEEAEREMLRPAETETQTNNGYKKQVKHVVNPF